MNLTDYDFKKAKTIFYCFIIIPTTIFISCQSNEHSKKDDTIEIVTNVMDFNMVDTIPSGWNHFRYINKSQDPHFILFDKYPQGKTIDDGRKEIIPVFQEGMDRINEGKLDEGLTAFSKLPSWFPDIVFTGGCGLLSANHSCDFTVNLEPGYYIMECYVKMPNGVFHGTMGMTRAFIVSDSVSAISPPQPDVDITLSFSEGIVYSDSIEKGNHIFEVYFKDQQPHENFVGHDINLVKLDDNTNEDELEKWMNWMDPKGLITPPPPGVTFLGGINDMPPGRTGYFYANLEPGRYAFIAEVPNSLKKGMFKTFQIQE